MNISEEKVDALNARVRINIEPDDYRDRVETILKDFRKKASLPGFRPGKVPFGMIKKMYEKGVLADELSKIVNESLYGYIQENKLPVLGQPLPNADSPQLDIENNETFELVFDLGLAPEFEVSLSDKDKFTKYIIEPGDDMIDQQVENLQRRFGQLESREESDKDSMIMADFNELNEAGEIKEGGIYHSGSIVLEFLEDEDVRNELAGLKVGDTTTVDPRRVTKGASDMAAMLGIQTEEAETLESNFKMTVKQISNMAMSELNEDFWKKVFGEEEGAIDEEAGRAKIKEQLAAQLVQEADRKLQNDFVEVLIEKMKLALPDEFLKRWMKENLNEGATPEDVDNDYDNYAKGLKWQLIENKIIEQYDLTATHEELIDFGANLLKQQMMRYGQTAFDEEQLKQSAQRLLQDQDEGKRLQDMFYGERVMGLIKSKVQLKDKDVSYDEFVKLASEKPSKKFNLLGNLMGSK